MLNKYHGPPSNKGKRKQQGQPFWHPKGSPYTLNLEMLPLILTVLNGDYSTPEYTPYQGLLV